MNNLTYLYMYGQTPDCPTLKTNKPQYNEKEFKVGDRVTLIDSDHDLYGIGIVTRRVCIHPTRGTMYDVQFEKEAENILISHKDLAKKG